MGKAASIYITRYLIVTILAMVTLAVSAPTTGQNTGSDFPPPPPAALPLSEESDSVAMPFGLRHTVPQNYEDLMADELAYDLSTPSNIKTSAEYDPALGCYIVRTRLGNIDIGTPFLLTPEQYSNWQFRLSMQRYYRERNMGLITEKEKQPRAA